MKILEFSFVFLLLMSFFSCDTPQSAFIYEAKVESLKVFGLKRDTAHIGITHAYEDSSLYWLATYNKLQVKPGVCLFKLVNNKLKYHFISLGHKQEAIIENVIFIDLTKDGESEMLVYMHYNYDFSYQGRELVIFQNPFDEKAVKEIFAFPYEQIWEQAKDFDTTYGVPLNNKRIANKAVISFNEGKMQIKGIVEGKKLHLLEYEWDRFKDVFILKLDEDLHEAAKEKNKSESKKIKGKKVLLPVETHEEDSSGFILQDLDGKLIKIPNKVKDALLCSKVCDLSNDGSFLIYTDLKKDAICLYNFEKENITTILEGFKAREAVSNPVWFKEKGCYFFAFVAIDLDEYDSESRIYVYKYDQVKKIWAGKHYDRKMFFECNSDGNCAPKCGYDFRFSPSGNLLYRIRESGHNLEDYGVLKL